ncbi:MAG: transposase family protein [Betaproteobacteria bacterium]|nr:transposase family protein [Betaproteobacteria bacterium]
MLIVALTLLRALAIVLGRSARLRRALLTLALCLGLRDHARGYRRVAPADRIFIRSHAKPAWVKREVIRLKALMPQAGCRRIADSFNRRFAAKRKITVGKTFVCELIRRHRYEIEIVRRQIENAKPKPVPKNLVWGVDLTGKAILEGRTCAVLAILEHASRAALRLETLRSKSSWALIRKLVEAIKRYGKPKAVRTDNESIFTSRAFRFALFLLGIRHQRTDPGCPWQNGRVERFFGTLKGKLERLAVDSLQALNQALGEFCFFYNHVRPHQNLAGRTPAEAWAGVDPFTARIKQEYWFEAWDGLLQGYCLRR